MSTAVLRSRNCIRDRFRHETLTLGPQLKSRRSFNPNSTRDSNPSHAFGESRRRRKSPVGFQSRYCATQSRSMVTKFPANNLIMGQVKILKRGETLGQPTKKKNYNGGENEKVQAKIEEDYDLVLGSTNRLGPDPETVQQQIRVNNGFQVADGIYAGSCFFASPPPSSLPVPGFLGKSGKGATATLDLRRLLRLDLV